MRVTVWRAGLGVTRGHCPSKAQGLKESRVCSGRRLLSIQRFGAWPHTCMPWDEEGRTILLPGWEVRPLRCPGSAITNDLNPHVLPASSQPLSQLPPLLTLMGTGDASRMTQRGSQGVLCTGLFWKPTVPFSWSCELSNTA